MIVAIEGQHIAPPDQPAQHFYSIHSWMGLVTCALFALQVSLITTGFFCISPEVIIEICLFFLYKVSVTTMILPVYFTMILPV